MPSSVPAITAMGLYFLMRFSMPGWSGMTSTKSETFICDPNSGHSSFKRVTAIAGIPRALNVGANSIPEDKGSTITTGLFTTEAPER